MPDLPSEVRGPPPAGGIDPDVKLPSAVAASVAAANAAQAALNPQPDPQAAPVSPQPVTAPVTEKPAVAQAGEPGSWEHRYHSMKGRYDQQSATMGQLQEQMQQLGDELIRTQQATVAREVPRPGEPAVPAHIRLTETDRTTYGNELIDFIQRAALDAVAPELGKTVNVVKQVSQRVAQTGAAGVQLRLDQAMPDWRAVNSSPEFRAWLRLPDVYSGVIRETLLKKAYQAADAPRVVAFFAGYKAEQEATGAVPVVPEVQPQGTAPVRQAAVPLETLVAPGRAKPATGDTAVSSAADKPIITRADITNFYRLVRIGHYSGRDADKSRDEAMIFAAQREGRVRG